MRFWWAILALLFPCLGISSEVTFDRYNISITGAIAPGDADKFRAVVRAKSSWSRVDLDSPGGDIAEAVKIAEIIKILYLETRVAPGKICASACSMMWLAGAPRRAVSKEGLGRITKLGLSGAGGIVGLHRPYLTRFDSVTSKQSEVMKQVQNYLEAQMMPRRLIDLMMSRPSNDIYWLNFKDLQDLGEYRPDVEEFLISKCDYVRATDDAFSRGLSAEQMIKAGECSSGYLIELHRKAMVSFKK